MPECQGMPMLSDIDIADSRRNLQLETASMIGKLDVIASHQQVIAISFIVEPQASDDFAARQIVFDVHKRVTETAERTHCLGRFESRRADPSKDQWSMAHRPDKTENFVSLTGESLPELRP